MMSLPGNKPDAAMSPSRFAAMSPRFALSLTFSESTVSLVATASLAMLPAAVVSEVGSVGDAFTGSVEPKQSSSRSTVMPRCSREVTVREHGVGRVLPALIVGHATSQILLTATHLWLLEP